MRAIYVACLSVRSATPTFVSGALGRCLRGVRGFLGVVFFVPLLVLPLFVLLLFVLLLFAPPFVVFR